MKYIKISKMQVIVILIIAMCMPIVSYAINGVANKENKIFFSSDKLEATGGEIVTLTLDLELIKYDNFEFILTSNMDLQDINTEQKIDTKVEENELRIISNKSELSMNKIAFYYEIPKNLENGSKIILKGVVGEYKTENEKQEVIIDINVVEEQNNDLSDEKEDDEKQDNNTEKEEQQKENQNKQTDNNKESGMASNTKQQTSGAQQNSNSAVKTSQSRSQMTTSNQEINTYNGESNNYLNSLVVSGYEINPQFTKTNNTYFATVDEDTTSINIIATPEDENAIVTIYGNENLKEGENKVLIFVTAENGEVKTYRIYVTRKA